jgi:hypothetical protein
MRWRSVFLGCVCGATITASSGAAVAEPNYAPIPTEGLFVPVGINLGGALHPSIEGGSGFLFGGEVSLAYYRWGRYGPFWGGGYVDVLRDFGAGATRFSTGPEFGWGPIGIDLGYLGQVRSGVYSHGFTGRFLLTIVFVTAYARWGHLFDDPRERNFGELGALLKFPIPIRMK